MNPRIQVEHTVTEEVTDVDLVQSQLRIASGETLDGPRPLPGQRSGCAASALQCRITTEDPANSFRPDTGEITTYRSPGGGGVRLDGGTTYTGAEVSAHFDSMLAKLTCRGRTFENAVEKARRAVAEFRIRGVSTNIPFLQAVLDDPDFAAGNVTTSFIETHPQLLQARGSGDRGSKLLTLPRRRHGEPAARRRRRSASTRSPSCPPVNLDGPGARRHPAAAARASAPRSSRAGCASRTGRGGHRHHVPRRPPVAARDPGPHPRPARRSRRHVARTTPELWSLEAWGGATYDVALRFLSEDPWERLAVAAPGGAEHLPADAAARPQHRRLHAVPDRGHRRVRRGGRGHRHRRVPDLRRPQRRRADAARDRGGARDRDRRRRGRALLHRRPVRPRREALHARLLPRPGRADRRRRRARAGDQGHGRAAARARRPHPGHRAARAVRPARCTCTPTTPPGGQLATLLAAIDAGVDAVDAATASMAGTTSQPPLSALVSATDHSDRETGLSLRGGERAGALLGGDPAGVRAVRVRACRRRPAGSTGTRSPAASCPTCASRRSRSGSARSSSRSRTCTPRPTTSSATWSR